MTPVGGRRWVRALLWGAAMGAACVYGFLMRRHHYPPFDALQGVYRYANQRYMLYQRSKGDGAHGFRSTGRRARALMRVSHWRDSHWRKGGILPRRGLRFLGVFGQKAASPTGRELSALWT